MKTLLALTILLSLAIPLPSWAAKPSRPPTQLWQKYPLGTQKLAPLVRTERSRARPPSRPARGQVPASAPRVTGSRGGAVDIPLWSVLLAAIALSSVLALAGENVIARARRGPQGRWTPTPVPERHWGRIGRSALLEPLADRRARRLGPLRSSVARLERAARPLMRDDAVLAAVVRDAKERSTGGYWFPSGPNDLLPLLTEDEMTDDLGARVATVLRAAEEVAERIRQEAYEEGESVRRQAQDDAAAAAAYARDLLESSERIVQERAGSVEPSPQNLADALVERARPPTRSAS